MTFWINSKKELLETAAATIKAYDKRTFPNIYILLKLICTMPVTSCEWKRTTSVMKCLNNYFRCTMGQDRLLSLALMHIHYEKEFDIDKVAQRFFLKQSRRMDFCRIFKYIYIIPCSFHILYTKSANDLFTLVATYFKSHAIHFETVFVEILPAILLNGILPNEFHMT